MFIYEEILKILFLYRLCAFETRHSCASKYGDSWKEYCDKVPYKIIPGLI
jgi:7-dehydrocholesterol reductase